MSGIGRAVGAEPPRVPTGGRAFVSMDAIDGSAWSVRVRLDDETPDRKCKRLGPSFTSQAVVYQYLDWIEGRAATFTYPEGAA